MKPYISEYWRLENTLQNKIMYDYYILEFHPDHQRAQGDGWVPQQVIVMETQLGRSLSPDEDVKHLNGNPHDNRVGNLQVVTPHFASKTTLFDSQDSAKRLSKTFVPCRFQRPCWKEIRAPMAREKGVYLPYICSYQTEGDIYACQRFWTFIKRETEDKKRDSIDL